MKKLFKYLGVQLSGNNSNGISTALLIIENKDGTPRWICNTKSKEPLFLKFYHISSLKAFLYSFMIKVIFYFNLQQIFFKTQSVHIDVEDKGINWIQDITRDNWALFTGTVGPNNKLILYNIENGEGQFYKIACSKASKSLIRNELNTSLSLDDLELSSIKHAVVEKLGKNVIKLMDLSNLGHRSNDFGNIHKEALREINELTGETIPIKKLSFWEATDNMLSQLESNDDVRIPKGIIRKLRIIADGLDGKEIDVCLSHGDFTSWNMYVNEQSLLVYDWELSKPQTPIGFDAFHFIVQQDVLVDRKSWQDIKEDIKKKIDVDLYKQWDSNYENLNFYLKLYLYINTVSNLHLFSKQDKWHEQVYWLLDAWNIGLSDCLKEEVSNRSLLIMDYFDFLHTKDYAAIKFTNEVPEQLGEYSDIDICIEKTTIKALLHFLKVHPLIHRINYTKKSYMISVQVFLLDHSMLSLDLIWKIKRKSLTLFDTKELLKNAYTNFYGVKQIDLVDMVRFIGLFYGLNNAKVPCKFHAYELLLTSQSNDLDRILYRNFIHDTICRGDLINNLKANKNNTFFKRLINRMEYLKDCIKQVIFTKGFVISFSGVDGVGKSTIIDRVKYEIEKKLRRKVVVLRHRPSLLPILSAWVKGKEMAEFDASIRLPRQGSNQNSWSSLFRFVYYFIDYFFGQFYVYVKYISRGYIVLYDRYYFDMISDSKRSNIVLPKQLLKMGYYLLLKPALNFLLHADADTVLGRKQELEKATIISLTNDYKQLFNELKERASKQYFTIENKEIKVTVETIINEMKTKIA